MASSDATPLPVKNTAFRMPVGPFFKTDGTIITSWTSADSEISTDGTNFTDCTNEATEIQTSGVGFLDLTSGEMNCDGWWVKTTISNTDAVPFVAYYATQRAGAYLRADVRELLGTAWLTPGTAGTPDVNVKLWNALSTVALPLVPTTAGRTLDVDTAHKAPATIAAGDIATDAITAASLKADAVQKIWDAATSALTTVGSIGKRIVDFVTTLVYAAAPTAAANAAATRDVNNTSPASNSLGAAVNSAATPADVPTAEENADAWTARNIKGGSNTGRTNGEAQAFIRNRWTVVGTTLTVYDTDDTTPLWTGVVTATPGADPITGNNPA